MKCPAGHETTATDYCDTCGIAMDGAATGGDTGETGETGETGLLPVTEAAPASSECPNCQTPNLATALFCEACGYDFTTGSMPRQADPAAGSLDPSPAAPENPSPPPADHWVAEVWLDPDWYADQESTDPMPSPGLPVVVALKHTSILIGRASRSRGIAPDIDLSSDSGISRRHAQLTTDGSRWFVEDLGSSNGTYVGGDQGALPKSAITPGQKTEITGDARIYLGAWTRVVIRRAAPGEL